MATKDEIDIAIKVVAEFTGNPDSGAIAELLKDLAKTDKSEKVSTQPKEARVVEAKETR
jgi:hypothetical protein